MNKTELGVKQDDNQKSLLNNGDSPVKQSRVFKSSLKTILPLSARQSVTLCFFLSLRALRVPQ